jgi:hypothetical protein
MEVPAKTGAENRPNSFHPCNLQPSSARPSDGSIHSLNRDINDVGVVFEPEYGHAAMSTRAEGASEAVRNASKRVIS